MKFQPGRRQSWWEQLQVPAELLQAEVVSIFKKGNPALLDNYRPISLLTSLYKVYATILCGRVVAAAEPQMQETQYGFRAGRSTAQPLYCVRRVLNMLERAGAKGILVFSGLVQGF